MTSVKDLSSMFKDSPRGRIITEYRPGIIVCSKEIRSVGRSCSIRCSFAFKCVSKLYDEAVSQIFVDQSVI